MSEKCTCPICRFCRGEISIECITWYLKGCVEVEKNYLNIIKDSKTIEEIREKTKYNRCDLDECYILLNDLKNSKNRNPNKYWDKALDQPENYILEEKDE